MPTNEVTIDYNRLETFHPATVWPRMIDSYFGAYPTAVMFWKIGLAGGLEATAQMKDWAEPFINGHYDANSEMIAGAGHVEWPVEFLPTSGTINGSGVQPIANDPAQLWTKARMDFNRKYTPVAIPEDEYALAQSKSSASSRGGAIVGLMKAALGNAIKTQLKELNGDILGTNVDSEDGVISLIAGIGSSTTDTTTYANISRSSITAWRGNYATTTSANWLLPASGDFSQQRLGLMVDTVTANGAQIGDLMIIMGSTAFRSYRAGLTSNRSTTAVYSVTTGNWNVDKGRGIPHSDLYYGPIPIIHDPNANALRVYLIDTSTTKMVGVDGNVFRLMNWAISEESTKVYSRLRTYSQIAVTKPNSNYYHLLS